MNDKLQRTPEWAAQRLGRFTSSEIGELLTAGRKKDEVFGKTAVAYIMKKLAERLTGQREEIHGVALTWGTEHEEEAIRLYEEQTGNKVTEVGFTPAPGFEDYSGGSPDGVIEKGIIEIKCPYTSKMHIESLVTKDIPEYYQKKYMAQMQWNMYCMGAEYCDFVSYDPRMIDPKKRLFIKRIERDDVFIGKLIERVGLAVKMIEELENEI